MGSSPDPSLETTCFAISTVLEPSDEHAGLDSGSLVELDPDATEDLLEECWVQLSDNSAAPSPLAGPLQRHLQRAKHVYRMSEPAGASDQANTPLAQHWQDWAWKANVLWYHPPSDTTPAKLCDPAGRQLLGPGTFDEQAAIPFLPESRQRRLESEMTLRNRNLDPVEGTAPLPSTCETQTMQPSTVARRMLGLFAVAARAEAMANGQTLDLERVRQRSPLAAESLSPREKDFFDLVSPPPEMVDEAAWRYESLQTLQWALQMLPDLEWPDQRCDLETVLRLILTLPHEDMIQQAILRPKEELLRAADLHVCLWWKLAFEGAAGNEIPAGLDPGVIAERVHALSWVLQLSGSVPNEAATLSWDQIGREIDGGIVG
ncbi:DUF4272 domain-containing protein [Rhodopirellula sp. JC737]|nr:DUF4272 domain-containing protein [Rhodopirellula sp. JC737]